MYYYLYNCIKVTINIVEMLLNCSSCIDLSCWLHADVDTTTRLLNYISHWMITQVRHYDVPDLCLRKFSLTGPIWILVEYPWLSGSNHVHYVGVRGVENGWFGRGDWDAWSDDGYIRLNFYHILTFNISSNIFSIINK